MPSTRETSNSRRTSRSTSRSSRSSSSSSSSRTSTKTNRSTSQRDSKAESRTAAAGAAGTQSPDKRYYRIGEVSRITGVKPYVLRYWESEFRWMAPQKSRSKQRLYRRRDIDMILLIKKMLYEQRFTIAGARNMLREHGAERALETGNLTIEVDHRSRYRKIRGELESIRAML